MLSTELNVYYSFMLEWRLCEASDIDETVVFICLFVFSVY